MVNHLHNATPSSHGHQLPAEKGAITWMRGPLGGLFASPWFDRATMYLLRRLFLPLSRLWSVIDAPGIVVTGVISVYPEIFRRIGRPGYTSGNTLESFTTTVPLTIT